MTCFGHEPDSSSACSSQGGGLLTAVESSATAQDALDVDEIVDWEAKQLAFEDWLIANDSFDEGIFKAGWDVPPEYSWDYHASWGRQQGAGECETFGPVGVLETQYMMNNCEFYHDRGLLPPDVVCRHDPVLPWLPTDDDPSGPRPFLVCESLWDYVHPLSSVWGTWAHRGLDLSEHVINACERGGYLHAGVGADDPAGWLAYIGTTLEIYAPRGLPYADFRNYVYWPPPQTDLTIRPDAIETTRLGTCPLVDRDSFGDPGFGTCDIEEAVPRVSRAAWERGGLSHWPFWCYEDPSFIAAVGDPPPEVPSLPVFFRLADTARWESGRPDDMFAVLAAGYVVHTSGVGHAYAIVGYRDNDDDDRPSPGDQFVVRNSNGSRQPLLWTYGAQSEVGMHGFGYIVGPIESYVGCDSEPLRAWREDLSADADGDGIPNGIDVCTYNDNACPRAPTAAELASRVWESADGDGWPEIFRAGGLVCAGCDNCPGVPGADRRDGDRDGLGVACDGCPHLAEADLPRWCNQFVTVFDSTNDGDVLVAHTWHGDGIIQCCDGCPWTAYRQAADADGDGIFDHCDPCKRTPTRDGFDPLPSSLALPPTFAGPGPRLPSGYSDADGDGVGDLCDFCPLDDPTWLDHAPSGMDRSGFPAEVDSLEAPIGSRQLDSDGDTVGDACDNCPTVENRDQANCNLADELAEGRPIRGDACDEYPCVDLCLESRGRATFRETTTAGDLGGSLTVSTTDPVRLDFCPVGSWAGTSADPDSAAFRTGVDLETKMDGCACRPWAPYYEDCRIFCPVAGTGGGRWQPILHDGTRAYPDVPYRPLYTSDETDPVAFGLRGDRYSRVGYTEYYAGCDVPGWCAVTSAERRVQQPWLWVEDLNGRFPVEEQDESRIAWFWARPSDGPGFAGYPDADIGNTFVSRRQRINDWSLWFRPPVVFRTPVVGHIEQPLGPPPWWGEADLGAPLLTVVDVLDPEHPGFEQYGFDVPGSRVGGLLVSEWQPGSRTYANLAPTKVVAGNFDLMAPAVALATDGRGNVSEFWTFGGLDPMERPSAELWHADRQLGVANDPTAAAFQLSRVVASEGASWPPARVGGVLAPRGPVMAGETGSPQPPSDVSGSGGFDTPGSGTPPIGLVLVGGRGTNGLLDDIWFYDGRWSWIGSLPDAVGGLADTAAVVADRKLWLFGGAGDGSVVDGLWWVDLEAGDVGAVPRSAAWPAARRAAAVTYDAARHRLVVFGGLDANGGPIPDLWAFYLSNWTWSEVVPPCAGSACPTVTGGETIVVDPATQELTVVANPAGPDAGLVSWTLREGLWQTAQDLAVVAGQEDCDADGTDDPMWGARCGDDSQGFPDFGRLRCDAASASLACRWPVVPGEEVWSYAIAGLKTVAAEAGRVVALTDRSLGVFDIASDGLRLARNVPLPNSSSDVVLWRGHALVADAQGMRMIRLADGTTVGAVPTCGKARRVFADGNRAYVVGLRSLAIVALSTSGAPALLDDLRIYPGFGDELVVVRAGSCSGWYRLVDWACDTSGVCDYLHRPPAAYDPGRLFVNLLDRTYRIDVRSSCGGVPCVGAAIRAGLARDLAVERPYLYVNRTFNRTAVYDGRTDEPWEYVGHHTVRAWVGGVASSSGHSFAADGDTLRVAKGQQP